MTIKELRLLTGLSQKLFSDKYEIPKRTIEDWEAERRTPPEYVVKLLERVVKEDLCKKGEVKMKYNVISKEIKTNPVTGQEIPVEVFYGPYVIVGHDEERFYVQHGNEGNFFPEGVEGCTDVAPQITGFEKALYKVTEY